MGQRTRGYKASTWLQVNREQHSCHPKAPRALALRHKCQATVMGGICTQHLHLARALAESTGYQSPRGTQVPRAS